MKHLLITPPFFLPNLRLLVYRTKIVPDNDTEVLRFIMLLLSNFIFLWPVNIVKAVA